MSRPTKRKFDDGLGDTRSLACLRTLNNSCKRFLIEKAQVSGKTVPDIGFGKGGDMWKYLYAGVKTCVGIDMNCDFIGEAKKRIGELPKNSSSSSSSSNSTATTAFHLLSPVHFERPQEVAQALESLGAHNPLDSRFDTLFAFFSIHTVFETQDTLSNFCKTIDRHLKVNQGHQFICTFMCGQAIVDWMQREKTNHVSSLNNFSLDASRSSWAKNITQMAGQPGHVSQAGLEIDVEIQPIRCRHIKSTWFLLLLQETLKPYRIELAESELFDTLYDRLNNNIDLRKLKQAEKQLLNSSRYAIFKRHL